MPTVIIGQSGQGNVVGNVRNTAGGLAVVNSGLRNDVAAYYPDIGIAPAFTIWVSGSVFTAINNTNGQIVASGTNGANVFDTVMTPAQGTTKGYVHVKAGDYNFTSGWGVGAATKLVGAGERTNFNFSAASGRISGAIMVVASASKLRDFNIIVDSGVMCGLLIHPNTGGLDVEDIGIFGNDATQSGTVGISVEGSQQNHYRNIGINTFSIGIRMISGTGGTPNTWEGRLEGIRIDDIQTGILLDNVYDNTIDNVHVNAPTSGGIILTNSARRNTISNIHSNSTTIPAVVIMTSGGNNTITNVVNASGGPTIVNSGNTSTNKIGAYFNEAGIITPTRFTIWESGGVYGAIRNTDGVLIASGTNAADLFNTTMRAGPFDRTILVKTGDYTFTSGINIGGGTKLIGEEGHPGSPNPFLNFDASSGMISGAIIASGVRIVMQNLSIFCDSGVRNGIVVRDSGPTISKVTVEGNSLSGTHGIRLTGGNGTDLYDVGAFLFDVGIFMGSGAGIFPEPKWYSLNNVSVSNNNTGILMDGAHQATFTDIFGDDSNVSGTIRLVGGASQNIIDGVKAANISGSVVILVSGVNNRITNITNASGGPCIVDLTSGSRNFVLPGQLQPVELISGTSPYTYTNASGRQELITVGGGTVSLIEFVRAGTTTALSGLTAGTFILNGGDKLTVTYSAAPAIKVIPTG